MRIGELARTAGVGIDTVRFYEKAGLLPAAQRNPSGYRRYDDTSVARLRFIRNAKELGFTLSEIVDLLSLRERGQRARVLQKAREKLRTVEARLRDLTRLRRQLVRLVHECEHGDPSAPCPILESFHED